ncbi:TadE/TadG family type IV pilus assembly protein [Sphingomonas sp. 1P06PA]|uniref:TadE/TadG family type IV pilus assembly protein n=1 Tax=Sphingomonas sp. 1P06PA TaxID=554121 RepID=UPI0039A62450
MKADLLPRLATLARRLRSDERGLAMIEFAVSLPVLLSLGLTGLEVANYGVANLRVSQIAMTAADNAARVRETITEVDVNELMEGAKFVGQDIGFARNGRIILSSVENNAETNPALQGQYIRWQRCAGMRNFVSAYGPEGTGQNNAVLRDGLGPANNAIKASPGTAMMFVEVEYRYQALSPFGRDLLGSKVLKYQSAFNVRQRVNQVIQSGGIPASARSTCDKFTA